MLYRIDWYYIALYRIASHNTVSSQIVSHHIKLYCIMLYRIISNCTVSYQIVSHHMVSCQIIILDTKLIKYYIFISALFL